MATPHIPCLRLGDPYVSLNQIEVNDYRDGSVKATVSQVNAGVIRRDLDRIDEARAALRKFCLLYTSPSPRDKRQSRMPSSA